MELNLDKICFLCLRKSPPKVKREDKDNFKIEDQDKCNDDKEEDSFFERVSLRLISKYLELNVNFPTPTTTTFPTCGENEGGEGQVVFMCQDCGNVTSKLSLLCKQLIEIQMKINLSLHNFHQKFIDGNRLAESEEKNEREEKARVFKRELELHRKQTILKCKRKLDLVPHPIIQLGTRVELPKMEVEEEEDEGEDQKILHLIESQGEEFSVTILKSPPVEQDEEEETGPKVEEIDEDFDWVSPPSPSPPSPPPPPPKIQSPRRPGPKSAKTFPCKKCDLRFNSKWECRQHSHIHRLPRTLNKKGSGTTYRCPLCPDPKPTFYGKKELERHDHIFHLDHLFASSKLKEISSPALFEEYCKHVIHIEGLLSRKGPGNYSCEYCGRGFSTWKKLHPHLLYEHKERLAKKVENLQRTTPPGELKKVTLPPVRDDRRCVDCGATFSQAHSLQRHRRESCVKRKDKSVSTARKCRCPECGMGFPFTANFYKHRRAKHPESSKGPVFL